MDKKPSILIVSSWYPSDDKPSEGSFVHEQAKMLQKHGHQVTVLKPNLSGTFRETIKGKKAPNQIFEYDGIKVLEVGVNVFLPKRKNYYYKLLTQKSIQVLQKEKVVFDIIHSHALLSAGIVSSEISQKNYKPLVHTEHTSGLIFKPEQFDEIDKRAIERIIKIGNRVLFVSQYAKENSIVFRDSINGNLNVLFNIVDASFFDLSLPNKKNQLITIGDYSERKNQIFLLNTWKEFNDKGFNITNCQLIFAGDGFDNPEFRNLSQEIGHILVLPRLNRAEVRNQIAVSKALLSTSKLETFGLTIAEALALGTPVVVSDSGGPREIVEKGDGYIVEQGNVDQFIEKLKAVLDGKHDSPEQIRARCKAKFGEEVIYQHLNKIYQQSI